MSYSLKFKKAALKEWRKLDGNLRTQFKKKLKERLQNPCVPSSRLSGTENRFKIKLRNAGYRLVYEVRKSEIVVIVIAVGKREKDTIYKKAVTR
ncbi:MAG: type II toxin-antitoxin system RelE/ParE family toxin [Deltaproteobacteria bacterium]|nr:type II toxin-antitoxin system RelE/ParE family toxin [Deltaproteobacteria bacterium]